MTSYIVSPSEIPDYPQYIIRTLSDEEREMYLKQPDISIYGLMMTKIRGEVVTVPVMPADRHFTLDTHIRQGENALTDEMDNPKLVPI